MITLATINKATAQQVFDQVTNHLLTQNCQSMDYIGIQCRYRGKNNTMCAIGCLISEVEYKEYFEGNPWKEKDQGIPITDHDELLYALQAVHDTKEVKDWPAELLKVAKEFELTFSVPA